MKLGPEPLVHGTLVKRYKRFLADVRLRDGTLVTAHCTNTGSLATCDTPGWRVVLTTHDKPSRKLRYTWELVHNEVCWIGINTLRANRLAEEAILHGHIPELSGYERLERERRYGTGSRIDLLLSCGEQRCYVEVKNASKREPDGAVSFPDAPTERGRKHLHELMATAAQGHRAVMLYVVQREDCHAFRPDADTDPDYANLLHEAAEAGVEALAYRAVVTPTSITLRHRLPATL